MLNFACTAKARKRTVTLTRPSRDDPLQVEDDDDRADDDEDDGANDDGADDDEIMMARLMMTKTMNLNQSLFSSTLLVDTRKVSGSSSPKWKQAPR